MAHLKFDCVSCVINKRRILTNVSGEARPGKILALMGSSGGGKTTLLDLLYGERSPLASTAGMIRLNGQFMTTSMRQDIAYIRQEVILPPALTPLEHLSITAAFHLKKEKREAIVGGLIKLFGLSACKDTRIGTGQEDNEGKTRGLSGGERRRLYIAGELIRQPRLILVDEPTSGLDYHLALSTVVQLHQIARNGCSIVMAIHQPSTDMYNLFDDLLALEGGRVMYGGPAKDAMNFFAKAGFPCPPHHNPAEHLISSIKNHTQEIIDMIEEASEAPQNDLEAGTVVHLETIPKEESRKDLFGPPAAPSQENLGVTPLALEEKYHAPFSEQFKICLGRSHTIAWRSYPWMNISMSVVFALIVGLVCLRVKSLVITDQRVTKIDLALFFVFIYGVGFMITIAASSRRIVEQKLIMKEYKSGAYSALAHFLGKRIAEFPTFLIDVIVYGIVVYIMAGLVLNAYLLVFFAIILICSNLASAMGIIYADLTKQIDPAMALQGVLSVWWLVTMGFYIPIDQLPGWLHWMEWGQWYRPGFEGLLLAEFTGQTIHRVNGSTFLSAESLERIGNATTYSSDVILDQLGVKLSLWQVFLSLSAWTVFLECLAFGVMVWQVLKK